MTEDASELRSYAIPVCVLDGTDFRVGSAFLALYEGQRHLVTVAHVATGVRVSPASWDAWEPRLFVLFEAESGKVEPFPLELFDSANDGTRRPRFSYVNHPHTFGHVLDVIAIPVSDDWSWVSQTPAISAERTSPPGRGQEIVSWGFPTSAVPWPQLETVGGVTVHVPRGTPGLLTAVMDSGEGYSGAPAFKADGSLVGMVAGRTNDADDYAQVIPLGLLLSTRPAPGGFVPLLDFQNF